MLVIQIYVPHAALDDVGSATPSHPMRFPWLWFPYPISFYASVMQGQLSADGQLALDGKRKKISLIRIRGPILWAGSFCSSQGFRIGDNQISIGRIVR